MDKVYFRQDLPGCWWIKDLTDIFYFKTLNLLTNQEQDLILSWTRNCDLSELPGGPLRRYDVEIDSVKYFFLVFPKDDGWIVRPENIFDIEQLGKDKNLLFKGDSFDVGQ